MTVLRGRNFLHCPGPTNLPERVLRAMHRSAVLYPSADLDTMIDECCAGLRRILKTEQLVAMYASSGHGAWEAALVNTLSAGDRVIVLESGAFSLWWKQLVEALGIEVDYLAGDWRHGIDADALEAQLAADGARDVKAVLMVHTDTASGVTNDCAQVRAAIDRAGHPALFMVDTIAALATCDFRMDEWRIDVAVCGSQKGLMLPPGIGFLGVSEKAFHASLHFSCHPVATSTIPRSAKTDHFLINPLPSTVRASRAIGEFLRGSQGKKTALKGEGMAPGNDHTVAVHFCEISLGM